MTAQPEICKPIMKCIVHVVIHILLKKAIKYKVLVDYGNQIMLDVHKQL